MEQLAVILHSVEVLINRNKLYLFMLDHPKCDKKSSRTYLKTCTEFSILSRKRDCLLTVELFGMLTGFLNYLMKDSAFYETCDELNNKITHLHNALKMLRKKNGDQQSTNAPITTPRVLAAFSSLGRQNLLVFSPILSTIFLACVRETLKIIRYT